MPTIGARNGARQGSACRLLLTGRWRRGLQRRRPARQIGTSFAGRWNVDIIANNAFVLEDDRMKAFLLACVCAIVLALVAVEGLNVIQKPVDVAFSTSGVRL
jgi:hypothetical protein